MTLKVKYIQNVMTKVETFYGEELVAKANHSHPSLFAKENKYSRNC